jgi:hypothetical protein
MGLGGAGRADQHHVLAGDQRAERGANRLVTLDQVLAEIGFEERKRLKCSLDRHEVEWLQGDGSADRINASRCGYGSFGR